MSNTDGTVLVAGASSGIGRAVAETAAAAGHRIVLLARRERELAATAAIIREAGGQAETVAGDATDPAACAAAVALAEQDSTLTAMINCVGGNLPGRSLRDLTPEAWSSMLRTNLDSAFLLTQAVLPTFRSHGGGLLVHVASRSVHAPDASGASYQAAKAGVAALAHATAIEEQTNGIRVSVVYPGMTDTPLVLQRPVRPSREELDRALQPADVASVIQLLLDLPARAHVPDVSIYPTS